MTGARRGTVPDATSPPRERGLVVLRRRSVALGVLAAGLGLGAGYGLLAARVNRNPYCEPPAAATATVGQKWGWRPSPLWLPSYLLCVVPDNGYGISRTRSGYLFRGAADRARYAAASTAIGAAMGGAAAGAIPAVAAGMRRFRTAPP